MSAMYAIVIHQFATLKLSPMILVWVEVGCDDNAITELATSQRLLSLLTINDGIELHENLQNDKNNLVQFHMSASFSIDDNKIKLTLPHPGTSTPSIGRGISTLRTEPYLLHSSLISSRMSSYSSSSRSSSGVTMLSRHRTSVGGPDVPNIDRPGTWIWTGATWPAICEFLAPTLARCTISFLSPNCMPFKPMIAWNLSEYSRELAF